MSQRSAVPTLVVTDRAAARLRAGHLWVYASDVLGKEIGAEPGALVQVADRRGKPLGSAVHSSASQIRLRLVSRELLTSEDEFQNLLRARLREAVEYRAKVVRDSDASRLVFSEADALPGLIADRYDEILVFQVLTQAWDQPQRKAAIIESLGELTGVKNIIERVDERIRQLEQLPGAESRLVKGGKSTTVFNMNGIRFHYDGLGGQKTGAFLDQRENYAAAREYARGRALDICTYQGGFALHLARMCESVTAVDISREVLEIAEQNEKLNPGARAGEIEWIEGNAFDLMKDYAGAGEQYDTIVLDPPAFAKTKKNLPAALKGYKELNLRAFKMLRPGGTLVTCSCSFHVSEADFQEMLASAAQDAHRSVRIVEKRTQSRDHPILLGVPETYYLKCLICRVD